MAARLLTGSQWARLGRRNASIDCKSMAGELDAEAIGLAFGATVRALRLQAGMSLNELARYCTAVCEIVRNMNRRTGVSLKRSGIKRGTILIRNRRPIAPLLVTPVKARSVVATRRRAKAITQQSR